MVEAIFMAIEIVALIGGKILGCIEKNNEVQATRIPECENDNKYDFYFINKKAFCFSINDLGEKLEFKLVNNSEEKIQAYIIDVKTKNIYSVANNGNKFITINAKNNAKIKVEYIDSYEQSALYVSRDQGVTWRYLQLSEILKG